MIYSKHEITTDEPHRWAVVHEACDPDSEHDAFLVHVVSSIRKAYGEEQIREMASSVGAIPTPADSVEASFPTDRLMKMFRSSLPDPDAEGKKPEHLKNYRSETVEIIAREALSAVYGFATPPALHAVKGNRNQPILGFDGWSLAVHEDGQASLVLIQVKGTDDPRRPPGEAAKLIQECAVAAADVDKLNGYLFACAIRCEGTSIATILMHMIVELETNQRIERTIVSPVIIRGKTTAAIDDLQSLRDAGGQYLHARACGMSLSIGTELTAFGRTAMNRARRDD